MSIFHQTVRARLSGLVAAGAICLGLFGAGPTPAKAADDTLIKLLLGATAVAILVHGASRSNAQSRPAQHARPRGLPHDCKETLRVRGRHFEVYNARCLQTAGYRDLPHQCRETIRTNHGRRTIYRAACLERHVHSAPPGRRQAHLPRSCQLSYDYNRQRYLGYSASCLDRQGVRNLPATCLVRGHRGGVYSASCLQSQGFARR